MKLYFLLHSNCRYLGCGSLPINFCTESSTMRLILTRLFNYAISPPNIFIYLDFILVVYVKCVYPSVLCRYSAGNLFHGLFTGYNFYSERCRILLQTTWRWPVSPALGVTGSQSRSSTSIALLIQESNVELQVSTGFLFITRTAEGTAGEENNTIPKQRLALLCQYLKHLSPQKCHRDPLQLSRKQLLKVTSHFKCPAGKFSRAKPPGLKCWELLGAFLQGLPISYPFCRSFSFPLPYHLLHPHTELHRIQNSHTPKAPFRYICRYSLLFFSLKPTHLDSDFSTSNRTDHPARWEKLFRILDVLTFHQQPCEQNFNQANGQSGK